MRRRFHNEKQKNKEINKEDLCASFQDVVVKSLTEKTIKAMKKYNVNNLIIAGGVSANSGLRNKFIKLCEETGINLTVPNIKYCTDNATMIAAAGYYAYLDGRRADLTLNSKSQDTLC